MATIFDVAKLAGVSIKTVSRVVNNEASIRPETRTKVSAAIEMLGYEPHRGARMMRSSKSGLIGLITGLISASNSPFITEGLSDIHLLRGAQEVCSGAGKTLLIGDMAGNPDTAAELMQTFISHRVEGVIYAAPFHQQVWLPKHGKTPLVLVNCFDQNRTPAVVPDDTLGQTLAVNHLVQRGHRRIAYIGLNEATVAGRLRKAAFIEACARAGLQAQDCPVRIGVLDGADKQDPLAPLPGILRDVMGAPNRPSALCLGNDIMAAHAARILEQLGIRMPEELALMGFDNDPMICQLLRPRLSTVTLPYFAMGRAAVETLLTLIQGEAPASAGPQLIAGEVVERDSTPDLSPTLHLFQGIRSTC